MTTLTIALALMTPQPWCTCCGQNDNSRPVCGVVVVPVDEIAFCVRCTAEHAPAVVSAWAPRLLIFTPIGCLDFCEDPDHPGKRFVQFWPIEPNA